LTQASFWTLSIVHFRNEAPFWKPVLLLSSGKESTCWWTHCLKVQTEPASGTLCFIKKLMMDEVQKKGDYVSESYTILKS
jgi:hypothetical protein